MSELVKSNPEIEPGLLYETERKFIPLHAEQLDALKAESLPIEQYYLSHPSEDFSLRCREIPVNGQLNYEATLKSRGELTADGLKRIEVTTPITAAMYEFYKGDSPLIRKLRATPEPFVAIDFFEDGHVQIESEQPAAWQRFCDQHELTDQFADLTGDKMVDNEWRAHYQYRRQNAGLEALQPSPELSDEQIITDVLRKIKDNQILTVQIRGRSGSGKTTIVQSIQQRLNSLNISSDVISTDDYHRGNTWLEASNDGRPWSDWDDPIVYDTQQMSNDLAELLSGKAAPRRTIDFSSVEPVYDGERKPVQVLLVEGIYAGAPEINQYCHLKYNLSTPLATCIGRRLLRDIRERPQFADPSTSLRYMLEYAEPAYRSQGA